MTAVTVTTLPVQGSRNDAVPGTHFTFSAATASCPDDHCHFCSGPETD